MKTTWSALRYRGKKGSKQPHHYEWEVGERPAKLNQPGLFFAFVDLKSAGNELPDVFIVPSEVIFKEFDKPYFTSGVKRRWRWHPKFEFVEQYKNEWDILEIYLKGHGGKDD
ncbi:hypothetical protein ACFLU9_00285 [Chloroflexota bacterium]